MSDPIKRDDAPEPCPFCKCEEVTTWFDREQGEKWGYASCDGCAARGPEVRTNWDREPDAPWHSEAIAAWNTRALPAIDSAAIPALQTRIEELEKRCSVYARADRLFVEEINDLDAKLTKAVAGLRGILKGDDLYPWRIAREVLAELEGK